MRLSSPALVSFLSLVRVCPELRSGSVASRWLRLSGSLPTKVIRPFSIPKKQLAEKYPSVYASLFFYYPCARKFATEKVREMESETQFSVSLILGGKLGFV